MFSGGKISVAHVQRFPKTHFTFGFQQKVFSDTFWIHLPIALALAVAQGCKDIVYGHRAILSTTKTDVSWRNQQENLTLTIMPLQHNTTTICLNKSQPQCDTMQRKTNWYQLSLFAGWGDEYAIGVHIRVFGWVPSFWNSAEKQKMQGHWMCIAANTRGLKCTECTSQK